MGLRCLLGHDFDEPEVEREREEDGNEMVVTIREVKTCRRCGERQIISENKEVTSIRSAAEVGLDDAETADSEPEAEAETGHPAVDEGEAADGEFEPPADADEDDGVILDEDAPEREPGEWPDRDGEGATGDADVEGDPTGGLGADEVATEDEISRAGERADVGTDPEAVEDDAEFIDAEEDAASADPDRDADADDGSVAWPEHDGAGDSSGADASDEGGPAAWPEHSGEDEGFDARAAGAADGDDDHGVQFGSGITPEAANGEPAAAEEIRGDETGGGAEGHDAEFVGGPDTESDAGEEFVRAESRSVEIETDVSGAPTEYYCPNCGYARAGTGSSMRAGDICPECRKGYIAEREA